MLILHVFVQVLLLSIGAFAVRALVLLIGLGTDATFVHIGWNRCYFCSDWPTLHKIIKIFVNIHWIGLVFGSFDRGLFVES